MRVRHPYAIIDDAPPPDGVVHWGGRREWSAVDAEGTFHVPDDRAENFVESWPTAQRFGFTLADLRVDTDAERGASDGSSGDTAAGSDSDSTAQDVAESDICDAVKQDGEVCGRERPCPYHD